MGLIQDFWFSIAKRIPALSGSLKKLPCQLAHQKCHFLFRLTKDAPPSFTKRSSGQAMISIPFLAKEQICYRRLFGEWLMTSSALIAWQRSSLISTLQMKPSIRSHKSQLINF